MEIKGHGVTLEYNDSQIIIKHGTMTHRAELKK